MTTVVMPNLMIEMDDLGKELNSFLVPGIVIARLEIEGVHVCLETNGEEGDMYLELVTYHVTERGDYVESHFSDPIYEMPNTSEEVEALFEDWLELEEQLTDEGFTGGKELYDEASKTYQYWSFENGVKKGPNSPAFEDRKDFVAWMEAHYA